MPNRPASLKNHYLCAMKAVLNYLFFAVILLCVNACSSGQKNDDAKPGNAELLHHAECFTITHYDNYTRIAVINPWASGQVLREYLLSSEPIEPDVSHTDKTVYIKTPLKSVAVLGVVHAGMLEILDAESQVTGVADTQYMNFSFIKNGIQNGSISDLGQSSQLNIERLIETAPEALIVTTFPKSGYGKLEKSGIPLIECVEYMENTPLGRAEWIKFIGAFIGKSREADSIYTAIERNYLEAKKIAEKVSYRPSVFSEKKYRGIWNVPGGRSYMAVFFHDAGADYLWKEDSLTGSLALPFEEVYDKAENADYWFIKYNKPESSLTYGELRSEYEPYSLFDAWRDRKIVGCNTDKSPYYEQGIMQPDLILKDMINIFHPGLAGDHRNVYFHLLPE